MLEIVRDLYPQHSQPGSWDIPQNGLVKAEAPKGAHSCGPPAFWDARISGLIMVHDHFHLKTCHFGVSTCLDQPLSFQVHIFQVVWWLQCSLFAKDLSNALQKCFGYFAKASLSCFGSAGPGVPRIAGSAGRIKSTPTSRSVFFWWFQSVCFKECLIYIAKHGMMTFGIFSQGSWTAFPHLHFSRLWGWPNLPRRSRSYSASWGCQKKNTCVLKWANVWIVSANLVLLIVSRAYINTYIHTYIHTYIYIYTHTTLLSLDKHLTNCNPQEIEKFKNPEMMVKPSSPSWTKSSQVPGGECRGRPRDLEGGDNSRLEDAPKRRRATRGNDDKPWETMMNHEQTD